MRARKGNPGKGASVPDLSIICAFSDRSLREKISAQKASKPSFQASPTHQTAPT